MRTAKFTLATKAEDGQDGAAAEMSWLLVTPQTLHVAADGTTTPGHLRIAVMHAAGGTTGELATLPETLLIEVYEDGTKELVADGATKAGQSYYAMLRSGEMTTDGLAQAGAVEVRLVTQSGTVIDTRGIVTVRDGADGAAGTVRQRRYRSIGSGPAWPYASGHSYDPNTSTANWSETPTPLTTANRYRYVTERTSQDGGTTWTQWSAPALDAYMGKDGNSITIAGAALGVIKSDGWDYDGKHWDAPYTDDTVEGLGGDTLPPSADGWALLYNNDTQSDAAFYDDDAALWNDAQTSDAQGTGYVTPDGHLWVRNGAAHGTRWTDAGQIRGDAGEDAIVWELEVDNPVITLDETGQPASGDIIVRAIRTVGSGRTTIESDDNFDDMGLNLRVIGSDSTYWYETNGERQIAVPVQAQMALELYMGQAQRLCRRQLATVRNGSRGRTGRRYYYAGQWDKDTAYTMSELECPFVLCVQNSEGNGLPAKGGYYMLTADGGSAAGHDPSASPYGNGVEWERMTNIDYVMTRAIFGDFASFGSAIIQGDFIYSRNGRIGTANYDGDTLYRGVPAYRYFRGYAGGASEFGTVGTASGWASSNRLTLATVELLAGDVLTLDITTCQQVGTQIQHPYVCVYKGTARVGYRAATGTLSVTADEAATYTIETYAASLTASFVVAGTYSVKGEAFEPNWYVDLRTGRMVAARGNFTVEAGGRVTAAGGNFQISADGSVTIRGSVEASRFRRSYGLSQGGKTWRYTDNNGDTTDSDTFYASDTEYWDTAAGTHYVSVEYYGNDDADILYITATGQNTVQIPARSEGRVVEVYNSRPDKAFRLAHRINVPADGSSPGTERGVAPTPFDSEESSPRLITASYVKLYSDGDKWMVIEQRQ